LYQSKREIFPDLDSQFCGAIKAKIDNKVFGIKTPLQIKVIKNLKKEKEKKSNFKV
jgi:Cu/Ag efflux pump CusA